MTLPKNKKDWFKLKRYPHIGFPLESSDRYKWIEPYVTNPNSIAKHAFLPFIHKTALVKKFRKKYDEAVGALHIASERDDSGLRQASTKKRELFYASHLDSLIFGYYAKILSDQYEIKLKNDAFKLHDVVNAYRSIPVNTEKIDSSNKCNIDFANDVFKYILDYAQNDFCVIAFDITSFFDNLDHALLRKVWADILNTERLPADHFNVFKNISRFSHIDIVDIFKHFQNKIYTRKFSKEGPLPPIRQKKISRIKYLRNQNAIAFCTKDEFLKIKGKLLQPSKTKKDKFGEITKRDVGIPQGSPISSVLANIYLLHFDKVINDFAVSNGGIYRRYSDDMVAICPLNKKEELEALVYSEILKYKLEIQAQKTQIFHFKRKDGILTCGQEFKKIVNWN